MANSIDNRLIDSFQNFLQKNSSFKVNDIRKTFIGISDRKIENLIKNFIKYGIIIPFLKKGVYIIKKNKYEFWDSIFLTNTVRPCIISMQTALSYFGYLKNRPYSIKAISKYYEKNFTFQNYLTMYYKIGDDKKRTLGIKIVNGIEFSEPEKAYIDLQYITLQLTKRAYTGTDIFLGKLDREKINYYLKEGNYPTTLKKAIDEAFFDHFN